MTTGLKLVDTRRPAWGWMIVVAVVGTILFYAAVRFFASEFDPIILKSSKEVGIGWMSFDQETEWRANQLLKLASLITLYVALSWWIVTRCAVKIAAKAIYGTWVMMQIFILVSAFAFTYGAGVLEESFPIVAFSNMGQFGEDVIPVLVGGDDKVYVILLLFKSKRPNETPNPSKAILYLPRTEVKWMTVLRKERLYNIAYYHDLKTLLPAAPTNPGPAPGPARPTENTPSETPAKSPPPVKQ